MTVGARAWACARSLVGTRFRLQGRDPANGLDCVGLVQAAYSGAGVQLDAIADYALRGFPLARAKAHLDGCGLARVAGSPQAGDIALFALNGGQVHLGIIAPDRLIHADAMLRRVTEAPAAILSPPVQCWRWLKED